MTVPVTRGIPISSKSPRLLPQCARCAPSFHAASADTPETGVPPVRLAAYHLRVHQHAADVAVLDTFEDLYTQASGED